MLRFGFAMFLVLSMMFPAIAQDDDVQELDVPLEITFVRGEGEAFVEGSIFLLHGDKIERSFRSDYYLTEGSVELEEAAWSIVAVGIGGSDRTTWAITEVNIDASPTRCLKSLGNTWANAFEISCPLRFLNFEVKTGFELALLLIIQH